MPRKPVHLDDRGYSYWRRAQNALDRMGALMVEIAPLVSQFPPVRIPHHTVAEMQGNLDTFSERFMTLVHEQKRKAKR